MATQSLTNSSCFNNSLSPKTFHLADFGHLIHLGPLAGGYRLVKHPGWSGYGIANEIGQLAFWDHTGKPFLTQSDITAWLAARSIADLPVADAGEPAQTQSRRDFLKSALGAIGLAVVAPVAPPAPARDAGDDKVGIDAAVAEWEAILDKKAAWSARYPARAALIDGWIDRIIDASIALEAVWGDLDMARVSDPGDVDAAQLLGRMDDARRAMEDLIEDLATQPAADLLQVATGRDESAVFVELAMSQGVDDHFDSPERFQDEIRAIVRKNPTEGPRLWAAWERYFGSQGQGEAGHV